VIFIPEAEEEAATALAHALVCARCSHAITSPEARISVNGSHIHTRLNPHGFVHEFGCFKEAPGCALVGPSTLEHTWFAGFAWRLAHCSECGEHLGWRFEGEGAGFFGLLVERVVGG
jgi:hypothetical protein